MALSNDSARLVAPSNRAAHAASLVCVALAFGAGCQSSASPHDDAPAAPDVGVQTTAAPPQVEYLSPTEHLVRIAMSLLGTRPSLDDLHAVQADPKAIDGIVDRYMKDPAFGDTIRALHNEALDVRIAPPLYPVGFPAIGALAGMEVQRINLSVTDAPLRLIEYVVMNDRPYTEIVTASYTMADGAVAAVWGLPYDGDGTTWQKTTWPDGRPAAGVLSDSMFHTRHSTTYSNSNRGRANSVSKALLCYDFLSRQISIDAKINLSDPQQIADAVRANPACASCHQTLDPLASYFGSFFPTYVPAQLTKLPFEMYQPPLASVFTITQPGYFGHQAGGLAALGQVIAEDPRFSLCAAKRFYSYLNQVPLDDVPLAAAGSLQTTLEKSGMNARALVKAVVLSDDFRVSHAIDDKADPNGMRKFRPTQLAHMIEDLTGYRWQTDLALDIGNGKIGRIDLMSDSLFGFEVLAGGLDSLNVTLPSHTMNASASLVLRGLAARAAPFVVEHDLATADRASRRLLTSIDAADTDEAKVRAELADLYLRIYGVAADPKGDDVGDAYALFQGALAEAGGDTKHAWSTTLFAMLQDVRVAFF